jgi:chromate transport protein ChrA
MINKVSTSKVFFMFLAFVVLFLPSALMMPAQASQISIVTSIGIDSSTEGIELSTTILVPKFESGFAKNTEVVSVNSENIA